MLTPAVSAIRANIAFEIDRMPTDGTGLPIAGNGNFGASPFLRQLSGKQDA